MGEAREYNAAVGLIDAQVAAGRGDRTAFVEAGAGGRSLTYGGLLGETNRMANLLAARGLGREDRVAIVALDTVDWPVMFLGAIRAGVVPVAINTLLGADQYRYILRDSRAKALFVSAPLLPTLAPAIGEADALAHVFVLGGEGGDHADFAAELASHPPEATPADTLRDETAFWLYSSGSTGEPKGALHVHSSMMETARLYGQGVLGLSENDVVFSAAKLFFAYGLGNGLSFPMSVGATTVLLAGRPTPADVFATLAAHRPTLFCGVPTLYAAMLAHDDPEAAMGGRTRLCLSAGEALPKEVGESWRRRFGVDIVDGVGSTEMLHIFLSNRPGDIVYGSSGRAVPGYEVRLVDEAGGEVGEGEVGELLVKGASAASGYWNQRAKSRATFAGEWTRTGDKYTRDGEGRFTYCGRTDDMFKVGGVWVSPFEVEQALIAHASVLEAAVVPYEDTDGLTKPRAFVVLQAGEEGGAALFQTLKTHVQAAVGKWKYPRDVRFVAELPKTATGKIQRFKLRD